MLLWPVYSRFSTLLAVRQQAADEQDALLQDRLRLQALVQVKGQAARLQQQLSTLQGLLPDRPDEGGLLNEWQGMANDTGLQLLQVQFADYLPQKEYVEMPVTIVLEGQYEGLLAFLAELQQGARAVKVKEIKIGKGRQEAPLMRVELTAGVFYTVSGSGN
ncbi:type 4a pilus biogenesis protein PilO [Desulforamulus hydrothermalis]|uniref:Uncharacterized protein n=1 Tax=Desulforamulus hydrothermalis Lam5 = DSM 18033 TaxID=1121428 RepID=K8EB81_9FIRM|nr:type 4a pilus biogenesis protein PilO [Desulforamulus hydrothermalis]CCO08883.1 conserved hypothetical protein [Desulforamulus hydrothermalis Lam5 = DSM 18033]SHG73942.1 type IV pilus assembly protein PilO [Desulforamulus hydrothermalis Lam5 = DSM 18033]